MLAHSLNAIRCMLKICEKFADVKFNSNKSVAMQTGPHYNAVCKQLSLCGSELHTVCQQCEMPWCLLSCT